MKEAGEQVHETNRHQTVPSHNWPPSHHMHMDQTRSVCAGHNVPYLGLANGGADSSDDHHIIGAVAGLAVLLAGSRRSGQLISNGGYTMHCLEVT